MDSRIDTVLFESILKRVNSISYLVFCILKFLLGHYIELLGLLEVKFKLLALTVALALLILFPVLDALLVPLLHESSVTLKLVYLDAAHFLLPHGSHLLILRVATDGEVLLAIFLFFKFLQV